MKLILLITSYAMATLILLSIIFYAPLARNARRGLIVPGVITFVWGAIRTLSIVTFRESSPPLFGFLVAPILSALFAAAARGLLRNIFQSAIRRLDWKWTRKR
jgi:hypothetical protein